MQDYAVDEMQVRVRHVPNPRAPLNELVEFAHSYNGYERLGASPEDLHRVVGPVLADALDQGQVPEWAGLDLIRGALFYMARSTRHVGWVTPPEESAMRLLVRAIAAAAPEGRVISDT